MRSFTAIIILCCIVLKGYGQITLTSADYPSALVGTDSLKQVTYSSPLPSLAPALGGIWDMTGTTDSAADLFSFRVAVPTYQYGDSTTGRIGTFLYRKKDVRTITAIGHIEQGVTTNDTFHNLVSITAGSDTMFIPAQTATYSSPIILKAFPCTMGGVWHSTMNTDINFQLTITMFSLSHQPFTQRRFTIRKDTVVGWGKVRVKNSAGAPSPYINVLQVHTSTYTTDSFYMGSSVAPGAYLTLLGLTQGKKDTSYTQSFYRTGEVTPLVSASYKDAGLTVPSKVIYHHQRLETVGLEKLIGYTSIGVYPNPATNELHVSLPQSSQYDYTISDISGKVLLSGQIGGRQGDASISLPQHLLTGLYQINISTNGEIKYTTQLVISR
ncbi:MAG: T9SS type A sorting domain-containing protein [Chitinophagaceae bacterium]|nr:T9SS type A sorting domain-containing protein [Chitinophagaceae bacterium]